MVPHRHLDLRLDEVKPEDALRDRMLHLNARVHLHEKESPVVSEQEFHRTRVLIADRASNFHRRLLNRGAGRFGDVHGGRFLDELLVLALERAFAGSEVQNIPVRIC
ncbi:hypothetical protein SDC9_55600 [bioreactor metagenome]|uniref:Uncharacterized protein n=1 Tax=bioreactor metagenome TaxID=1076179 RepID=A0A644X572_9ZZZZ